MRGFQIGSLAIMDDEDLYKEITICHGKKAVA